MIAWLGRVLMLGALVLAACGEHAGVRAAGGDRNLSGVCAQPDLDCHVDVRCGDVLPDVTDDPMLALEMTDPHVTSAHTVDFDPDHDGEIVESEVLVLEVGVELTNHTELPLTIQNTSRLLLADADTGRVISNSDPTIQTSEISTFEIPARGTAHTDLLVSVDSHATCEREDLDAGDYLLIVEVHQVRPLNSGQPIGNAHLATHHGLREVQIP